ncbi:MAG: hypothetical protein ACFFG0_04120 [Candidatus Thorarchaeota archaeon]
MKHLKLENRNYSREEVEDIIIQVKRTMIDEQLVRMEHQFDSLKHFESIADSLDPTQNSSYKVIKCDRVNV